MATTGEIDFIPIIHDIRYAIRDSQIVDGLVTISIPADGSGLLVSPLQQNQLKHTDPYPISLSLPFQKKELILDPKQMIYLVDFSKSGKRREFFVQVLGDAPQPQQQTGGRKR